MPMLSITDFFKTMLPAGRLRGEIGQSFTHVKDNVEFNLDGFTIHGILSFRLSNVPGNLAKNIEKTRRNLKYLLILHSTLSQNPAAALESLYYRVFKGQDFLDIKVGLDLQNYSNEFNGTVSGLNGGACGVHNVTEIQEKYVEIKEWPPIDSYTPPADLSGGLNQGILMFNESLACLEGIIQSGVDIIESEREEAEKLTPGEIAIISGASAVGFIVVGMVIYQVFCAADRRQEDPERQPLLINEVSGPQSVPKPKVNPKPKPKTKTFDEILEENGITDVSKVDVLRQLICPITQALFKQAVVLVETGQIYERAAIETHLETRNTCPVTGKVLQSKQLSAVLPAIKNVIEDRVNILLKNKEEESKTDEDRVEEPQNIAVSEESKVEEEEAASRGFAI